MLEDASTKLFTAIWLLLLGVNAEEELSLLLLEGVDEMVSGKNGGTPFQKLVLDGV